MAKQKRETQVLVGNDTWYFVDAKKVPALPLKTYGSIRLVGWDIPLSWAIDASNQAWKDCAHGTTLHPCTARELFAEIEDARVRKRVAEVLGLPMKLDTCKCCQGVGLVEEVDLEGVE